MKKFLLTLCMAVCMLTFTACSSNNAAPTNSATVDEASYLSVIQSMLETLSVASDAEIVASMEAYKEYTEGDRNLFNAWMLVRPEVGEFVAITGSAFDVTEESVVATIMVDYTLRDAEFKIGFLEDGTIDYSSFNVSYTFGEKMSKAGLNTVIGISVVFIVLILISILISLFKYINAFEQMLKNRKENKTEVAAQAVDSAIAQIVSNEEEELVDDYELVAVIAAAIAASEGTSTDGFVVRSIKKANKKKWQNA